MQLPWLFEEMPHFVGKTALMEDDDEDDYDVGKEFYPYTYMGGNSLNYCIW